MKPEKRASLAKFLAFGLIVLLFGPVRPGLAGPVQLAEGSGWVVMRSSMRFERLGQRLEAAIASNGMNMVSTASASDGAKAQGISIPGNRVVGVFRNDFARRMLAASIPAGIEAPIRFYLTENVDGTSTLAYRTPSAVFAPYAANTGPQLTALATELDAIFDRIAEDTIKP